MCSAPFGKAAWLSSVYHLSRVHCFDEIGHSAFMMSKGLQQGLKIRLASCVHQPVGTYGLVSLSLNSNSPYLEPDKDFQHLSLLFKCLESSPCGHPDQPTILNGIHR